MSGEIEGPQWPPRSPYEAAMTSPSSRRRMRQYSHRLSPTPSPLKRSATTPSLRRTKVLSPSAMSDNEEEDEETLQLRLQAIETQLKLKKLQSRKARDAQPESEDEEVERAPTSRSNTSLSSTREHRLDRDLIKSKSASELQVPLSPDKRRTTVAQEQRSPGRVLLGIDKGLRGKNVSLRRAPALRGNEDPFIGNSTNAGATPGSALSRHASIGRGVGREVGKSFNDRIAESRDREKREAERRERVEKQRRERSTGFGVQNSEIQALKQTSEVEHEQVKMRYQRTMETGFSREEVLRAANRAPGGLVQRNNSVSSIRSKRTEDSDLTSDTSRRPKPSAAEQSHAQDRPSSQASSVLSDPSHSSTPVGDATLYEPYSSSNLSRRYLPHAFLKRTLEEKKPVLIPRLLAEVKAPVFDLPEEFEMGDMVLFATIASASQPLTHKDPHRTQTRDAPEQTSLAQANATRENERGKYMVLTLTDLKWTLDLFLFSSAYTRWSKLTPGTVVAILNPDIMAPPKHKIDTGRWSLTLNSSDDTILEIGTNKDLGWCKAIKKDGQQCPDWVDKRKTEYCEFHVDAGVERLRRGRMEIQGMGAGYAPGGKQTGRHGFFGSGRRGGGGGEGSKSWSKYGGRGQKEDGLIREGKQYDRGAHSAYFMAPNLGGRSAASLLDADEEGDRGGREERVRKALAQKEKEREIARKLGNAGGGAGAEYLRDRRLEQKANRSDKVPDIEVSRPEQRDALALGLRGNKATDVSLGPLKRKRSETPGGAKKKTRFVTAKGIREAGRESLPGPADVDLDDGLDII